jgi:hypothetical protein
MTQKDKKGQGKKGERIAFGVLFDFLPRYPTAVPEKTGDGVDEIA